MYAMVLNDGTTFTDLEGCKVVEILDEYEGDEIDAAVAEVFTGKPEDFDGAIVAIFHVRPFIGAVVEHRGKLKVEER